MNIPGITFGSIKDSKKFTTQKVTVIDCPGDFEENPDFTREYTGESYTADVAIEKNPLLDAKTKGPATISHRMTIMNFTEESVEEFLKDKKPIDLYDDMTVSGYNILRNGTNGIVLKGMIARDMRHYCHDGEKWVNRVNVKDTI